MTRPRLPKEVKDVDDVKDFFTYLYLIDNVSFHPDDSFYWKGKVQYVDRQGNPTYTVSEAKLRDELMSQAWKVLDRTDIDIYCLAMWIGYHVGVSDEPDPEICPALPVSVLPPIGPRAWSPRKPR